MAYNGVRELVMRKEAGNWNNQSNQIANTGKPTYRFHQTGKEDGGLRAGGGCRSAVVYVRDVFVDHVHWMHCLQLVVIHIQQSDIQ